MSTPVESNDTSVERLAPEKGGALDEKNVYEGPGEIRDSDTSLNQRIES